MVSRFALNLFSDWPTGPGPNFVALLTVSTESALSEAGNSVLTASVFHGLAANLGFCACYFTPLGILRLQGWRRNSALARKRGIAILSAEFGSKQSHEIGPSYLAISLVCQLFGQQTTDEGKCCISVCFHCFSRTCVPMIVHK